MDSSCRTDEPFDDDEYEYPVNPGCYECGGRGWMVTCIDDMCHGQDECIHSDPPTPCRNCNRDGSDMSGFF